MVLWLFAKPIAWRLKANSKMILRYFNTKNFNEWDGLYRSNFFNSIGGYKSLNLIGTKSGKGVANLGVFFSVNHVGSNPPLVGIIFRPPHTARHTLENIYDTGYFTVNSVQEYYVEKAHQASAKYDAGISEFHKIGLRESYHGNFFAPYVESSRIKMGLRFVEKHDILANGATFVVGEVVECWVDGDALNPDGFIDHSAVENVAVNGLNTYYSARKLRQLPYARPNTSELSGKEK